MHELGAGRYPYSPPKLLFPRVYIGLGLILLAGSIASIYMDASPNVTLVIAIYSATSFMLGAMAQLIYYKESEAAAMSEID